MLEPGSRVLDIGSGTGNHAAVFRDFGHKVTCVDPCGVELDGTELWNCRFEDLPYMEQFDCVWLSHVLEHQQDVASFLHMVCMQTRADGIIAVTVPPAKHQIVGGHVSLWNAGLLLYRLVTANFGAQLSEYDMAIEPFGLDCSRAKVLSYGYNISVIVRKKIVELPDLVCDHGDIIRLKHLFPEVGIEGDSFNGNIQELNWDAVDKKD